jgi:hypothetical protein
MISNFSFRPGGGDYMGLTADTQGVFHAVWVDSRSGTSQVWTSRIEVTSAMEPKRVSAEEQLERADITKDIDFIFDPAQYSMETHELSVPIRLWNRSQTPLYPPFNVEVQDTLHPGTMRNNPDRAIHPEILNASNGQRTEGATFDYSSTLRDLKVLQPGAVSGPVIWRFKIPGPAMTDFLYIKAKVTGFTAKGM